MNIGDFLFEPVDLPEWAVGLILLIISLFVLCFCLISLVKILSSIFEGHLKTILVKTINANFPGVFQYLTPYVAIAVSFFFSSKNPKSVKSGFFEEIF